MSQASHLDSTGGMNESTKICDYSLRTGEVLQEGAVLCKRTSSIMLLCRNQPQRARIPLEVARLCVDYRKLQYTWR